MYFNGFRINTIVKYFVKHYELFIIIKLLFTNETSRSVKCIYELLYVPCTRIIFTSCAFLKIIITASVVFRSQIIMVYTVFENLLFFVCFFIVYLEKILIVIQRKKARIFLKISSDIPSSF